ncbi:MAG: hypothetical protein P8107_10825 [Spirochaetia bacterium]
MKKGKLGIFFCLCFLLSVFVSRPLLAQSNVLIDQLLREDKATFGKSAYLCLMAANLISQRAGVADALAYLEKANWGITIKKADEPIHLGELAYLLMKAFDMKGGIMYSLAPGPRYACRELAYLEIITGRVHPDRIISGERALQIISNMVAWKEDHQ